MMTMTTPGILETRKRLETLKRASSDKLPRFQLMKRDVDIVKAVHDYRCMTTPQIEALFFTQSQEGAGTNARCKLRLRLLYHHRYLFRDEQPTKLSEGRKPLVYFLDELGEEYLSQVEGLEVSWSRQDNDISDPFIKHHLATNDVRVAVTLSATRHAFAVPLWLDERLLKRRQMRDVITIKGERGGREKAAVVPDAYFRLETGEDSYHFMEETDLRTVTVDASTEGRRDWARKVQTYLEYYRSGAYEKRYHTRDLRVLTITTSEKRLTHLREATEAVGGKSRFWFTTFDAIKHKDILTAPIWEVAAREGLYSLL